MKTIRAEEIPANASARKFLESLDLSEGEVLYERNGKPHLVIFSAELIEQRRQAKEKLFSIIEKIRSQNPGTDSDDVLVELGALEHPSTTN